MENTAYEIKLVSCKSIRVILEGSGDPAELHDIVGIHFLDRDGQVLQIHGEEKFSKLDSYSPTI